MTTNEPLNQLEWFIHARSGVDSGQWDWGIMCCILVILTVFMVVLTVYYVIRTDRATGADQKTVRTKTNGAAK